VTENRQRRPAVEPEDLDRMFLERANAGKDTTVKYHLAMAYAKAGDLAHGKTTLAAALKANPNAPEAKLAQQVLAEAH
jgi:Tfp pilus assembly protein PilF